MKRVCVFCGSRLGLRSVDRGAAEQMGRLLAERGLGLVYGGGRVGLMGVVADAALAAGGEVIGVIPRLLLSREVGHAGLSELRIVDTMQERKVAMADLSDAFVALPGGIGTLDELFEVWTWNQLGFLGKPFGLLDTEGFYSPLVAFLDQLVAAGFVDLAQRQCLRVESSPQAILDALLRAQPMGSTWREPERLNQLQEPP